MMPSPPIDDSYDTCHPRWLAAGRHQAYIHPLDRPVMAPQIRSCNARTARSISGCRGPSPPTPD